MVEGDERERRGEGEERQRREKGNKINDSKEEGKGGGESENRLSRELEEGNKEGGANPLHFSLTHVP